jgi:hypothetical protein
VESVLLSWIHKFRFANQRMIDDPTHYHFSYLVPTPSGLGVLVIRPVLLSGNYLTFSSVIQMTKDQQSIFDCLAPSGRKVFEQEFRSECAKSRVSVIVQPTTPGSIM